MERRFAVQGLGEIAIRCRDLTRMVAFYRDTIGLELLAERAEGQLVFFKIANGVAGHTSVLALFDSALNQKRDQNDLETGAKSSLHHLALSLPYEEQQAVMDWFASVNQAFWIEHFQWIGWRGVFTRDPDGNTVELVAFDPTQEKIQCTDA